MRPFVLGSVASVALLVTFTALFSGSLSHPGRRADDRALGLMRGGSGSQLGAGNYSCDDVNANPSGNSYSSYQCSNLPNASIPNNATCVFCADVRTSGLYTDPGGGTIVKVGPVDCTAGGTGSNKKTGACVAGANGKGHCDAGTVTSQCTGNYNQYVIQIIAGGGAGG